MAEANQDNQASPDQSGGKVHKPANPDQRLVIERFEDKTRERITRQELIDRQPDPKSYRILGVDPRHKHSGKLKGRPGELIDEQAGERTDARTGEPIRDEAAKAADEEASDS
jgi:hypothetical protein